jgi:hypothetical protein
MKINLSATSLRLKSTASPNYDDAAEMFSCYGAHVTCQESDRDIKIQAVDTDWLEEGLDEAAIIEKLTENGIHEDTAEGLAQLALRVWGDMQAIDDMFAEAVAAHKSGDLEATVEALREARNLETDHGDDPSTSDLAEQLLEEINPEAA